ncbi:hypothetical protein Csa_013478 [Cucumis sativus]|uniref:Uncharacterized protein n=1 Tax=Cucumis sativus TaxID=3659 RepID=A0A0A0LU71_CUCSA|nr:hypothetical protein Csa_013478 [Cucumis sativus]
MRGNKNFSNDELICSKSNSVKSSQVKGSSSLATKDLILKTEETIKKVKSECWKKDNLATGSLLGCFESAQTLLVACTAVLPTENKKALPPSSGSSLTAPLDDLKVKVNEMVNMLKSEGHLVINGPLLACFVSAQTLLMACTTELLPTTSGRQ